MTNGLTQMRHRVLAGPKETRGLDTRGLRETFLVADLFADSELRLVITDMDRLTLGGAMPRKLLPLPASPDFGTSYFTERRELGIVNLGAAGHIWVGANRYSLGSYDFLYIGAGNEHVAFEPCSETPPCFYFLSCPAHRSLPVVRIGRNEVPVESIGNAGSASRRLLRKYIHPDGAASCQLVMGWTELEPGSVWNTMPPHTHSRRSEVYLYAGLEDGIAVHLMGEPEETRHLVVRDREAVLSPAWSVHSGAGTRSYSFVWGMAGENQVFTDMDPVEVHNLR